jgi:hypothetical protein
MMPADHNANAEMHPEDRAAVIEGRIYASERGSEFCERHKTEIFALITEYGDGASEAMLANLRERFWLRLWEEKPAPVESP